MTVLLSLIVLSLFCASPAALPTGAQTALIRASIDAPASPSGTEHGTQAPAISEPEGPELDDDDSIATRDTQGRRDAQLRSAAIGSGVDRGWTGSISTLACAPRAPPVR